MACGREFVCRFEIEESIISYIPVSDCRNEGSMFSVYTKTLNINIKHNIIAASTLHTKSDANGSLFEKKSNLDSDLNECFFASEY